MVQHPTPIGKAALDLIDNFLQASAYAFMKQGMVPTHKMVVDSAMKMYVDAIVKTAQTGPINQNGNA
jgi:FMN-dependent NADH-azoreductase